MAQYTLIVEADVILWDKRENMENVENYDKYTKSAVMLNSELTNVFNRL